MFGRRSRHLAIGHARELNATVINFVGKTLNAGMIGNSKRLGAKHPTDLSRRASPKCSGIEANDAGVNEISRPWTRADFMSIFSNVRSITRFLR
jgi:hypothetical protein